MTHDYLYSLRHILSLSQAHTHTLSLSHTHSHHALIDTTHLLTPPLTDTTALLDTRPGLTKMLAPLLL